MYTISWLNGWTEHDKSESDLAAVLAENRLFRVGLVPHPN